MTPLSLPLSALERSDGFSTLKWKVGDLSIEETLSLIEKYPGRKLRLDGNRKWSLEKALLFSQKISPEAIDYFEEPLATFDELSLFAAKSRIPLALDESLAQGRWSPLPHLKALVVKPTLLGGLPKTDLPIVLSSSFETGVGLLSIARLAPQNPLPLGLDTLRFLSYDLLTSPLVLEKGKFIWNGGTPPFIDSSRLCKIAL